jgi:O-antigen ligase
LALVRAPHTGLSLTTLQMWVGVIVAARAMQLAVRAHGAATARTALLAMLIAGPVYMLLLPLMQAVYGETGRIDWNYTLPAFNHGRRMGHLLTASAAAGIGLIAMRSRGPGRAIHVAIWLLTMLALALVLWTGARGAWLGLGGGAALTLIAARAHGIRLAWGQIAALVPPATVLALVLPSPGHLFGLMDEIRHSAARIDDLDMLSSGRLAIWQKTLDLIAAAPVQGYGWGQFAFLQRDFPFPQVHDLPLEMALGLGVPMAALGIGIMLALWLRVYRRAASLPAEGFAALTVLNTFALYSLVSGVFFYAVGAVLTGVAWGICLSVRLPGPQT